MRRERCTRCRRVDSLIESSASLRSEFRCGSLTSSPPPFVTPVALLLVLLSAVTHAYWNYLLKRAGGYPRLHRASARRAEAIDATCPSSSRSLLASAVARRCAARRSSFAVRLDASSARRLRDARHGVSATATSRFIYPIARGGRAAHSCLRDGLGGVRRAGRADRAGSRSRLIVGRRRSSMQLPEARRARGVALLGAHAARRADALWRCSWRSCSRWARSGTSTPMTPREPLFAYFYGLHGAAAGICYLASVAPTRRRRGGLRSRIGGPQTLEPIAVGRPQHT